jgi:pilus assembly protein TadC
MNRKNLTWFGFKITQKQSVQIFILSLIGFIFSLFFLLSLIYPMIMTIINYINYGYGGFLTLFSMILSMSTYLIFISCIFIISTYSVIRARKIAKDYSEKMSDLSQLDQKPKYCPNCGELRIIGQNFCKNCGEAF